MSIVPRRLVASAATTPTSAAGVLLKGTLVVTLALLVVAGLVVGVSQATAAPVTTGFIVPVPDSSAGSLVVPLETSALSAVAHARSTLGERFGCPLRATVAPDGRVATQVDTGSRFDMLGVLFRTTPAGVRTVEFRLRTSLDGQHWTQWFTVVADAQSGPAGSVYGKADLVTEPVWVGPARFVDYEQTAVAGGTAPVSDVRLACVESDVTTAVAAPAPAATPQSGAVATGSGAVAVPRRLNGPTRPPIVTARRMGR